MIFGNAVPVVLLTATCIASCDGASFCNITASKGASNSKPRQPLDQLVGADSADEKNCTSWGAPLFEDKFDGSVSFHTVSNAQCPLKDGMSQSSAMNYQFDLQAQRSRPIVNFFVTMTRDGKSYPDAVCQNNQISCIGSPSDRGLYFFDASRQAGLTKILMDLNRKHRPL